MKKENDFVRMSNEKLIEFIDNKYHGKTLSGIRNSYICKLLRDRGLMEELISKGVLIRKGMGSKHPANRPNITGLLEDIASAGETQ